jgi:hypothetical protein
VHVAVARNVVERKSFQPAVDGSSEAFRDAFFAASVNAVASALEVRLGLFVGLAVVLPFLSFGHTSLVQFIVL